MNLSFDELSMVELLKRHPSMKADLGWSPPHCQPQSTIAIIIPFRDRESHLRIFLNNLIPFLQRQMLGFQIFIIDQVDRECSYVQVKPDRLRASFKQTLFRPDLDEIVESKYT